MKVLIVSSSFKKVNQFSVDFLNGFLDSGVDTFLLTDYCDINHSNIIKLLNKRNNYFDDYLFILKKNIQRIRYNYTTNPKYSFADLYSLITRFSTKKIIKKIQFKPDAIFLLSNDNFINYKNLYEISSRYNCPVYILMIDMAAITGGCHYAWNCKGYINSCGNCPGLNSSKKHDFSNRILKYKQRYLDKMNVHLIAATEHQYKQALSSSLYKNKLFQKVLLGFDIELYKPASDKKLVRESLKLPIDKKIVLFGAYGVHEERKGFKYLKEAIDLIKKQVDTSNIVLLIVGQTQKKPILIDGFSIIELGFLDSNQLIKAYQASDIFVCPSIEDSGPSMINHSILCGLPVVSFNMGVASDLVISGKTGYMANLFDSDDLSQGIYNILNLSDEEYSIMSKNCRDLGLQKCDSKKQIDAIISLMIK